MWDQETFFTLTSSPNPHSLDVEELTLFSLDLAVDVASRKDSNIIIWQQYEVHALSHVPHKNCLNTFYIFLSQI